MTITVCIDIKGGYKKWTDVKKIVKIAICAK